MIARAISQTAMIPTTGTISAAHRPKRSWSRRPNSALNENPAIGIRRSSGISVA